MLILSACVAVPDVFWFPPLLTPGNVISAEPLNDTPPISLAFSNVVAVRELPVQDPDEPVTSPVTLPLIAPLTVVAVTVLAYTVPDK